jgi:hypothetical protein
MGLKDDIIFLGLGLTIGIFGPMLAGYAGVSLPWSTSVMFPDFGGMMMPAAAMQGEYYGYDARARAAAKSPGRTSTIVPRGAGRNISSHTGNTIGFGGDLTASPPGAFAKLLYPGLTGTTQRYVRS